MESRTDKLAKAAFLWAALWLFFGLAVDFLHGTKDISFLADSVRREMWRLAHAHGMLLSLFFVLADARLAPRRPHAILMFAGLLALPLGFFLGGIKTTETDPFVGVMLVPAGGFAYFLGFAAAAWAAWRGKAEG
jgi:hypothetical protein